MTILYFIAGLLVGGIGAWLISKLAFKDKYVSRTSFEAQIEKINLLTTELGIEKEKSKNLAANLSSRDEDLKTAIGKSTELTTLLAVANANMEAVNNTNKTLAGDVSQLKSDLKIKTGEANDASREIAELKANNNAITEKLQTQKTEIEELKKQFNTEFENIANRILEEKTEKFTKINHENLHTILKPLGENIDIFKKKIEEVYDKESKERFSLGKEVEKLVLLNQKISEEANNLTNALKGNSKVQGDWGQMILENILEKSGLVKDREYFIQEYLKDEDGNYLKNEDGSKMQPDVIIAYPDNRKVIVASKVSLTAYSRYAASDLIDEQKKAIDGHLRSIKKHIEDLSRKNYQDFAPSLDFVMMFVPNEPAYLLALQSDPDIWHFAYNKRILLISPTNLIAALKLLADLWKREYQNKNAQEIAKRGSVLYDKFVSFVDNLSDIGINLSKTQKSYEAAFSQLKDGQGNLIWQIEKLKGLGIKSKKTLPPSLLIELPGEEPNNTSETEH